jgi:hypothetical protein
MKRLPAVLGIATVVTLAAWSRSTVDAALFFVPGLLKAETAVAPAADVSPPNIRISFTGPLAGIKTYRSGGHLCIEIPDSYHPELAVGCPLKYTTGKRGSAIVWEFSLDTGTRVQASMRDGLWEAQLLPEGMSGPKAPSASVTPERPQPTNQVRALVPPLHARRGLPGRRALRA